MPATIGHVLTATTPDNTSYEIRPSNWNSSHAVSLAVTGSEVIGAFSNANNVSFGLNSAGAITASASYLTGIGISGGTQSSLVSQVMFSNANGITFGLNSGTLTASYSQSTITTNGLLSALGLTASGSTGPATGLFFSNVNGVTFGNANGTITASVATLSQSSVVFSNANNVSFSQNGSTVTASASFSQSIQTQGQQAVSLFGINTSGTLAIITSGTMYLAGGNNVTLSQSGNSIIVSGANVGGAQTGISGISAGTTSVNSGTIVFSNLNGVSFGFSGQTLTASVATSGAAQTGISGIIISNSTFTSGTVSFVNANGISFGSSGANGISASYTVPTFNQSNQTLGFYASSNTAFAASSLTIDARNITIVGSGEISIGMSNSSIIISTPLGNFDSVGVSNIGNTAGNTGLVNQQMVFAGTNNITLNQSTAAGGLGTLYISGPPYQAFGVAAANTTITSGTVVLQNANGISFGSSGANGISASYTVPSTAGLISGISVSAGTTSSGVAALSFSNANAVSFGFNSAGAITASIPAIGGAQTGISGVGVSNNTFTSGTVILQNANGISFGSSGANGISASYTVPTQTVQPVAVSGSNGSFAFSTLSLGNSNGFSFYTTNGSVVGSYSTQAAGVIAAGTQTGTTGTVVFSNANNITFGMSNSSVITASFSTSQSAQPVAASASNASFAFSTLSFGAVNGATFIATNGSIGLSYTVPSTAGLLSGINVSGGTTSNNLSVIVLSNANNVSFGLNGSTITASAASQTNQTLGVYGLGNQVGTSSSAIDARSLSLYVSGAGISAGWSNSSLVISASPYVSSIGVSTSGNTLGNTGLVSNQYVFAGINNITLSQVTGTNGATMIISGPSVAGAQTGISGISAGGTLYTSGTVNVINSNGFSLLSTTGQGFVASYTVPSQTVQSIGIYATGNTSYGSSGTVDARSLSFSGSGLITVGYTNGTVFIGDNGSQSNQTIGVYGFGNQTGTTSSSYDARSLNLSGAGNISVGNSAGSVIISGSQTPLNLGVSTFGNTTGTTGLVSNQMIFAGIGNISLSQSVSGQSATLSIVGAGGINAAAGTQTQSAGTLSFSNANGISFGLSASSILTASYTVPTQTAQPVAISATNGSFAFSTLSLGNLNNFTFYTSNGSLVGSYSNDLNPVIAAGTQTGLSASSGMTFIFSNSNNVSFGMSNSSVITASFSQSNQSVGMVLSGNTSGASSTFTMDARSFYVNASGNISAAYSAGSLVLSGSGGGGGGAAISAGTNSQNTGTVVFSNGNGVSFGLNAGALTASIATQTNQTIGAYLYGNSTGSSSGTFDARTLNFSGAGALTFGVSNSSVLMSVPATSSIVATGGLSLSVNGATISMGVITGVPNSFWNPAPPGYPLATTSPLGNASLYVYPADVSAFINISQAAHFVSISLSTSSNSSMAGAITFYNGIYTRNGSTLSLYTSGSASFGFSNTSNNSAGSIQGLRLLTAPALASLSPGDYWVAFLTRTNTTNANWFTASNVAGTAFGNAQYAGPIGSASSNTLQMVAGFGIYSTTTNGLPASIGFSQLTGHGSTGVPAPYVTFNNFTI